jgi:hypothetical protein
MSSPTLLPSLARAIRGLSALFWGLPVALFLTANLSLGMASPGHIPSVPGTLGAAINTLSGIMPAALAQILLLYGLYLLREFQPQERVWIASLERARVLAWLNLALLPFGFWFSRRPQEPLFSQTFLISLFSGLFFLVTLNLVLRRLAAMLPDETLRADTRLFTALNIRVLVMLAFLLALTLFIRRSRESIVHAGPILGSLALFEPWHLLVPGLIPIALTMTMLWKTKEVIITSVFGVPR